jgi:hypothetical protein
MHEPKTIMSSKGIDKKDSMPFWWSTDPSKRVMTMEVVTPNTTMTGASPAPNHPRERCTLTFRTRTKAD